MNYIANIHFGWMDFKIPVKKRTDNIFDESVSFSLSYIEDVFDELIDMCVNYYNNNFAVQHFNCEDKYVTFIIDNDKIVILIDENCLNAYICEDNPTDFIKKLYEDFDNDIDELIHFNSNSYNFYEDEDKTSYIEEVNSCKEYINEKLKELSLLIDII